MSDSMGLIFGALGIYGSFLYYGSLQEDVFAYTAADGTQFKQTWLLQVLEAFANVFVGFSGMMISGRTVGLPLGLFASSGLTQVLAKVCTNQSLAVGLSFPVATLGKSAKMAPVMAGSLILGGASYTWREYIQVLSIIVGTVMVSLQSGKEGKASTLWGIVLIVLSLTLDGCTGGVQQRLKAQLKQKGTKEKPYDFMFWTNFFMMLVALVVSTALGETSTGWTFMYHNPSILKKVVLFAACSAIGQSFIFYTIANYGPLKVATVTTTRKIFSVLLSIFMKGHVLSTLNWCGILVGSLGIAGELLPSKGGKGKKH